MENGMTYDEVNNGVRLLSPCCGGKLQIVLHRSSTQRSSFVVACCTCEKLHVVDTTWKDQS